MRKEETWIGFGLESTSSNNFSDMQHDSSSKEIRWIGLMERESGWAQEGEREDRILFLQEGENEQGRMSWFWGVQPTYKALTAITKLPLSLIRAWCKLTDKLPWSISGILHRKKLINSFISLLFSLSERWGTTRPVCPLFLGHGSLKVILEGKKSDQKSQNILFSSPYYLEQKKWTNLNDPNNMDQRFYIYFFVK